MGRNCRFLQGADTNRDVGREIGEAIAAGCSVRREILNYRKDGTPFWNDLTIDPVHDDDGKLIGFVGLQYEATATHLAKDAHLEADTRLENILAHVPGYVYRCVMLPDGTITLPYLSPSINAMLEIDEATLVTSEIFYSRLNPDDLATVRPRVLASAAELSMFRMEFRLTTTSGRTRWFRSEAQARPMADGGVVWDGLTIEITAEKTAASELAFLAVHDPLTGLSHRVLFKTALLEAIEAGVDKGDRLALFFIDLDGFEDVNDALGHSGGDDVLRELGRRLTNLAETTNGMAARLAGEEFALLMTLPMAQSVTTRAAAIGAEMNRPMLVEGQEMTIQACIGVATYPTRGAEPLATAEACRETMKQADLALQAAKQDGPGSHRIYTNAFDDRTRNRMALRQSMKLAIAEDQFELHYHPVVELATGAIVGAEALVRWNHPTLGLQRPDLFIPLAEASGLIVPLGAWVMEDAMRQAKTWRAQGFKTPQIAINVSSIQLQKPGFIAAVEQALARTGADPRDFELELTEGVLIEASAEMVTILKAMKALGFCIAIDDFGTGHSTFKYLRDFPVDKMKIDQTFVRQLVIDSSDASIIRAMIALSRSLGIQISAEGIETTAQRDFLRDEGCEIGQGYLFSLPLAAEDFGWMLREQMLLPRTPDLANPAMAPPLPGQDLP